MPDEPKMVYVVMHSYDHEGCVVEGVFSTEAKAEAFKAALAAAERISLGDLEVEEWKLDRSIEAAKKEAV